MPLCSPCLVFFVVFVSSWFRAVLSPQAMNDAHCHFLSTPFFTALGRQLKDVAASRPVPDILMPDAAPHETALERLGWDAPGTPETLADRWVSELDRSGVDR